MPSRAYSLGGWLTLKQRDGALSLLRMRKRYFFVLDEMESSLLYFKDEADFTCQKEPLGRIGLDKAAFASVENNTNAFLVYVGERQFELEADNRTSCETWMDALSSRETEEPPEPMRDRSHSFPPDYEQLYSKAPEILRPSLRKLSNNPTSTSNLALSVLEEKLLRLSNELSGECNGITPSMDEWVGNWIQRHNYTVTERTNSNSSTSSSPRLSGHGSVFGSEREEHSAEHDELVQLRMVSNQQKVRMHELQLQNKALEQQNNLLRDKAAAQSSESSTSRFLNTEVARLNKKCVALEGRLSETLEKLNVVHQQMQHSRKEYVFALQSAIRIPLHDNNSLEVMQVKLIGGDVHKKRVSNLVAEARLQDPSLPTLQSLQTGVFVDSYGFRQHITDEPLAVQYMATQLHTFYENNEESAKHHKRRWKDFLENNQTIPLNRDTKALCRGGVPNSLRPAVWRMLIHQQVHDLKLQYGRYYFRNLCSQPTADEDTKFSPTHLKQINLDLLRTMPSNVHFMSANCKGVSQLQQVLRAFCIHNSSLGYCQGMNFLAATALLFLPPEDVFWFLVAMTEKYFDSSYFDANLTGAQADQEVLKELLEWKQPALAHHLAGLEVDLTTITLNWFIALFFDAVPFQTLLRMWDCFLLEGPKVLFRFSLVLLGHYEQEILLRSDTIGIMKVVKAAVRLCYDVDGLFQKAFCDLRGLPSRAQLRQKQLAYLNVLKERLSKRNQIRNMLIKTPSFSNEETLVTDVCPSEVDGDSCFVVSGNQTRGKISRIKIEEKRSFIQDIEVEFDCRVASMVAVENDLIFVGLISGYVVAVQLSQTTGEILWELKLPDTALRLRCINGRLFAALASGTLTVLENVMETSPSSLEMYHVPLGSAPLTDSVLIGDNLWVTTGCKISIVDSISLSSLMTVFVACSTAGGGTPFFEKILCACPSDYGLFLTTAHSTLIQLWSDTTCRLLFDVAFDHRQRKPSLNDDDNPMHIMSLCYVDGTLWVGTSDGYVFIYSVEQKTPDAHVKFSLRQYPAGRRLSPETSPGFNSVRTQLCYIPTPEEAHEEEQLSRSEFHRVRRLSKVSINIDQDNGKYSVCVNENNNEEKKFIGEREFPPRRRSSTAANWTLAPTAKKSVVQKGTSNDSVFISDENAYSKYVPRTSTGSSNQSLEYDDIFEMYSDEDNIGRQQLAVSPRRSWEPTTKTMDRPTIRRKDLLFDEPTLIAVPENDASDSEETTPQEESASTPLESSIDLGLTMKLKISDKPVRRVVACESSSGPVVVSCSGSIKDDEALLVWRKDLESSLWINDPVQQTTSTPPPTPTPLKKGSFDMKCK